MLEIKRTVAGQPPTRHALNLVYRQGGRFTGRVAVMAKEIVPWRNEQADDTGPVRCTYVSASNISNIRTTSSRLYPNFYFGKGGKGLLF